MLNVIKLSVVIAAIKWLKERIYCFVGLMMNHSDECFKILLEELIIINPPKNKPC